MCGGSLEVVADTTVMKCEYCGMEQTLPKLNDDRRANLYDRANHFRRNNEFDKAMNIYEQILNEDTADAEAYWSLVLCRYGIEYVEDPTSHKRIPTVNRAQFTSIFDDNNYKSALQYADSAQRSVYEAEARAINEIQKGILAISQKEEPFDVFICYKETDNNGRRTPDSVLANDLYHQLTLEGFKVFFARITLEDKLGSAYEPYIFAALNSAKVMVVLGTKPEYFNAVWVKNEWSRYLSLIKTGAKKVLVPAYKDMDPYDLPEEFSHLQAQDMGKLGFMQDLIRGIKKIAQADTPKTTLVKETVISGGNANTAPLLKRAFMFLEDGDWNSANEYCERVLDIDPENAQAYLGKLMAKLHVRKQDSLKDQAEPFDGENNYRKIIRFADEQLKATLTGYIEHINTRNKYARLDGIYTRAKNAMSAKNTESGYKEAAHLFESIREYRDSASLADKCYEKAEVARKDAILAEGNAKMTGEIISNYESAIKLLESISGWKDADEKVHACQKKIEEIKAKAEADRLERERKAEADRLERERKAEVDRLWRERKAEIARKEAKRKAKLKKKIILIPIGLLCMLIAFSTICTNALYNDAVASMDDGKYAEAIAKFEDLDGYKDSADKINECHTILEGKYNDAVALMDAGKYSEAIVAFKIIDGYQDSAYKISKCRTILKGKYNDAVALMDAGKYSEAIVAFEIIDGYQDSADKISECYTIREGKYNDAVALMDTGNIVEAYEALVTLDGYKDSADKANSIYARYKVEKLKSIKVGDYVFFGAYEQDNNTSNGKEYIEWLVLEVRDGKALVISIYALDCQQYNTSDTDVTWETCTLRKWLNNNFINSAFTADEKAMIPTVTVSADKNPDYSTDPGKATQDQVFSLSITEANKYFNTDSARQCKPTAYAVAGGAYVSSFDDNCWWWLRSPGDGQTHAASVLYGGGVLVNGYRVDRVGSAVRPALWIDLNS